MPRNGTSNYDADTRSSGPDELSEDMSRNDLIFILEQLRFRNGMLAIRIDRHVRDFLVTALREL
jgi:hypothetical protein